MDMLYPISFFAGDFYFHTLLEIAAWYLYLLGLSYSFDLSQMGWLKKMHVVVSARFLILYLNLAQSAAVAWSIVTANKNDVDIVYKNLQSSSKVVD